MSRERFLTNRLAERSEELLRLSEIVDDFWRNALVIESAVRKTEGQNSPVYREILAVIHRTQDFYKGTPRLPVAQATGSNEAG